MRRTGLKGLAILFVAVLIGGVTLVVNSNAADTIKIGFVADVSGIGATFYKSQKAAIDLFIEQANAGGGILGKKLEVVVRDAQLKPDIGANMARELILAEKCDFLIGPTSSAVALAVTKVSKEFKKVVYFHTSNTEALTTTDYQPYMFQVVPNTVIEGRGIAQFLSKKPFTKYVYIGPDYAYGHTQYNSFKDRMAKLKPDAKILETIWVKVGETNYSPYIPTLMAKDPQVLFTSLWGGGSATFIKQAKPYGFFNKTSITSLYDLDMLRVAGMDMPEGQLGYARAAFYAIDTPQIKEFNQKYFDKFKEWPADWAIMAYDGLIALTDAIKKVNSVDSEKVVTAIGGLKFKSLRGDRFIRAEDHMMNAGIYVGTTAKDPKYKDFLIMKDVVEVPAEEVWFSLEEVKKLQSGQK
ncbi:MAG: ABC transporter substrate-binding protein [Thermodesulfobacteriota bacterium]